MAVRNDCFGGTSITDGYIYTVQDFNDTFDEIHDCVSDCYNTKIANNTQNTLENAINIVKLQYCNSLADIDHDYMVVDVFTDSTGYNNTVLPGLCFTTQPTYSVICCHTYATSCNYGVGINWANFNVPIYNVAKADWSGKCFAETSIFCYSLCCVIYAYNADTCCNQGHVIITGTNDDLCCTYTYAPSGTVTSVNHAALNCYCYIKASTNCFDFYCNGVCKCQVTLTQYPEICVDIMSCLYACSGGSGSCQRHCVRMVNLLYTYETSPTTSTFTNTGLNGHYINNTTIAQQYILTTSISYNTSVSTSYLTLDKVGIGSVVYDVFDADNTSTAIATSLSVNTLHSIPSAQCHVYKINQLSDGVSCIKSYAIAVSEA